MNAAYVAALPSPTLFYVANVVMHLVLGTAAAAWLIWKWRRSGLMVPLLLASLFGVYLAVVGTTRNHFPVLWAHIGFAVLGMMILLPRARAAILGLALLAAGLRFYEKPDRIKNPQIVPVSMTEEGQGPKSPFWPSSATTNTGGLIPSDFFMDSKLCGECHKDIYEQFNSSMHHFSSFYNPVYSKAILHMQELSGTQGSKWCAGCHDHAVFFNGRFDKPIKDQLDTPEAQNGLGCVSCHSIVHVQGTMGQAGVTMMYPPLHRLAESQNPVMKTVGEYLNFMNPEPHRMTFIKPFMRQDSPEFCGGCHKVHLDQPVNHYRWLRGFNEYDAWQASGVSGQGARSFYYPPKPQNCRDCHMPLVASKDPGNRDGMIHNHRFAAANTAIPYVNGDTKQLEAEELFLKSGFVTVDIFAATPIEESKNQVLMKRSSSDNAPQANSTMGAGEESDSAAQVMIRNIDKVAAPLDAKGIALQPGTTVRVDAIVRTRKVGHTFPAGTVDAYDCWLEFQAKDANGKIFAWNGTVDDSGGGPGSGPVDKNAHMYKSYQLDGAGNPINKRNAWQTRSVFYVHLIGPGADDTVHYRMTIPKDAVGPITLEAKLNYRKFSNYLTKFAFAGVPKSGEANVNFDSREYSFDSKPVPNIPIVTLAKKTIQVALGPATWTPIVAKADRERWNDWGIGMLLQGDIRGAEYAFHRVTEAEPGYADGWLNIGRALVQEGETDAARPFIAKALQITPGLARANYFMSQVQKADGDYDDAVRSLRETLAQYPRDRVVLNQLGRILFLQRKYAEAVPVLKSVFDVDAEDLQAHYTLMLVYRGLGQADLAAREQQLFLRFKADESAQSITEKVRLASPEDNNERQQIHDHPTDYIPRTDHPVTTVAGGAPGRVKSR